MSMNTLNFGGSKLSCGYYQRFVLRLIAAISLTIIATALTFAQGTRGTIRGTITDPNGAIVAGATVSLFDVSRQQEIRSVQADENGIYQFLEVDPAVYNIIITGPGFAETRLTDVKVEPNRNLQLDAQLALGTATANVTVTATQELVDRESPTLGTTVDSRRIVDLPLNGRNVLDLVLLQPGVTNSNLNTTATFGQGSGFRVNGQRGVENNITLDGANNNEVAVGGTTGAQPRPDAVQEFRVLTSNFEAEFGRNTGSIVNVVTKNGNNEFHGNARFFYRPTVLSAARFFDQALNNKPRVGSVDDFRRRFERKEFGAQIGGPIHLPRFGEGGKATYSGKNKAFFFIDLEGRRQLIGNTQTITGLPTTAERAGLFNVTARRDCNNNGVTTDAVDGPLCDPTTRAAFPGNQIPISRFSPIALYYLNFLPIPDASGTASAGANEITNNNYFTSRFDYLATRNQTINFTLSRFDSLNSTPFAFGGASVPGFGATNLDKTYNAVLRHTYTITPNMVNSFLIGYARNAQPGVVPQNTDTPEQIGFQNTTFVANRTYVGPPRITLTQRALILGNTIQGPQARTTTNAQLQDSLSWAKGHHRFKFGVDGTKYFHDQTFLFINQGIFGFSRTSGPNTTGDDFADLLIGNTPSSQQYGANGLRDFRQTAMAAFGQDTWRVSDSLTLSLGLRWEYTGNLYDKYNRVAFYRTERVVSTILTSGQLRTFEGSPITVPAGGHAPVGVVYVGDPDPALGGTVPRGGAAKDLNNFAPRVGFAWSPKGKGGAMGLLFGENHDTVIRGGFGVYYGAVIGDTQLQQLNAPGFNGTNAFFGSTGIALSSGTLANPFGPDPFPNFRGLASVPLNVPAIQNPFTASQVQVSGPVASFPGFVIDPKIRTPYTYQYNLTYERGFMKNYVVSFSYVGNRGRKLYGLEEANIALGTFFPAPASFPAASPSNYAARRVNPDLGSVDFLVTDGNSWYNALEVDLQKRYSNGLLFQVAYTYSKSVNDVDTQRGILDKLDRKFGKARSSDDVPHRFVASFIYDLPVKKLFDLSPGFMQRVFDGWSFGGIYTYQSGTPFSIINPNDELGTSGLISFADLGAPFQLLDPRSNDRRAFNADAFHSFLDSSATGFNLATQFRRGTSLRNQFRAGNIINNWDLILSKKTRLWSESTGLELRFEAFNALNHTQFTTLNTTLPNTAPGTPVPATSSFGRYTGARESRVIQIGARFTF
jgi:outer membrane receptor protein involved in Fe transport